MHMPAYVYNGKGHEGNTRTPHVLTCRQPAFSLTQGRKNLPNSRHSVSSNMPQSEAVAEMALQGVGRGMEV